jgi:Na+/proline symporter
MLGGLFLMLSYFGCDQSQVQRYLTAKSTNQARRSLLMSAYWKIPLQALILLTGVLVFVFFLFRPAPMLFNPVHAGEIEASDRASDYQALESEFGAAVAARQTAASALAAAQSSDTAVAAGDAARAEFVRQDRAVADVRARAVDLVKDVTGDEAYRDVNYVFPTFVTEYMPVGLVGLLIAAVFAAAMSSIAAELNSLSTATVIDFYRRHMKPEASDAHYLFVSKLATAFWGAFACVVAMYAVNLGSLIEVVNRFGSFFYGSILGVFVLALGFTRATGTGAFVGLFFGMGSVAFVAYAYPDVSFLWHNVIGAVVVVVVGTTLSRVTGPRPPA